MISYQSLVLSTIVLNDSCTVFSKAPLLAIVYRQYSTLCPFDPPTQSTIYVTRHEKTGLMYTKYTYSYYGAYLLYG